MPYKNKAKQRHYQRARYKHNPPTAAVNRSNHLKYTYGISMEEYSEILQTQGNVCGICKKKPEHPFNVDHDHNTGQVRGVLCRPCNVGIGLLGDTVEGLRCALAYLERTCS